MQVSLDAVDWTHLTSFGDAKAYFDWYYESPDPDAESKTLRIDAWSDSARLHFHGAEMLLYLAGIVEPTHAEHLNLGIRQLISEGPAIDDFATAEASEGHYWISASPESTIEIKSHLDAMDLESYIAQLIANPPESLELEFDDLELEEWLIPLIGQHTGVVDLAVENGYGLLGHWG